MTMLSSLLDSFSSWSGPLDASSILVKLLTTTLIASAVLTQLENHRRYSADSDDSDPSTTTTASGEPEYESLQIRWIWENDHQLFLQSLQEGSQAVEDSSGRLRLTLSLRPNLFLALADDAAEQVVQALAKAPIHEVVFNDSLVLPEAYDRWIVLCQCLGSLDSLDHVKFYIQYGDFRALAGAMQYMRNVANLSLLDNNEDEDDRERFDQTGQAEHVAGFATALQDHPTLHSLTCRLGKAAYDVMLPDVLPVIPTIPLLQQVMLAEHATGDAAATSTGQAAALIAHDSLSPPEICITNLEFASDGANYRFCQGLARTKTSRIHLDNVLVDPVQLATALGTSNIAHLKITNWPKKPASLPVFLATLAETIATMPIESLDLENAIGSSFDRGYDVDTLLAFENAMQALVRATSTNSTIRVLKLPSVRYTQEMDAAVAVCVGTKTSAIQEITLCCPCMPPEAKAEYSSLLEALDTSNIIQNEPTMPDTVEEVPKSQTTKTAQVKFPLFRKAMRSNFTLQHIYFKPCALGCACEEPFDEDSKLLAAVMTRLNREGRKYLGSARNNRQRGLKLLESVQDDMNCIFVHLQENPLLCQSIASDA